MFNSKHTSTVIPPPRFVDPAIVAAQEQAQRAARARPPQLPLERLPMSQWPLKKLYNEQAPFVKPQMPPILDFDSSVASGPRPIPRYNTQRTTYQREHPEEEKAPIQASVKGEIKEAWGRPDSLRRGTAAIPTIRLPSIHGLINSPASSTVPSRRIAFSALSSSNNLSGDELFSRRPPSMNATMTTSQHPDGGEATFTPAKRPRVEDLDEDEVMVEHLLKKYTTLFQTDGSN